LEARGDVLVRAGKYAEAENVLTSAVSQMRSERGMKSALVLALGNLAAVYTNTDRESLAEATLTEAIAVDNQTTGYPQHQLAVLLANKGNYRESARLAGAALALHRKALSPDDPLLLTAEGTYAMTLSNLHRFAEADPLLRELVADSIRVRGPNHPDTLVAEVQLGENLIDLQRFAEASTTLRGAAMALDRALDPQHHYALGAWSDYAAAACNNHEQEEGLRAAQRVLDTRARTLPADDYHFAISHVIIGLCLTRMQRYAEAEPVLREAVQQLEASRGAAFYQTQRGYATLSELYAALGRKDDAATFKAKLQ
jgi:Arc/MetJ-type ribon-helix-helix transcriptional regulator